MTDTARIIIIAALPALTAAAIPTVTVLIAMLTNNKRIDDLGLKLTELRQDINRQFDLNRVANTESLLRVEGVLDARLKAMEDKYR